MRKKIFNKIIPIITLVLIATILISSAVYAATWEYKYPVIFVDTSGANRTNLPVMLGFGGQNLVTAGKINSNGLNSNAQVGTSSIKYMMSTTNCTSLIPLLPNSGKTTVDIYTGYSPLQTAFSIITGVGGYVTTPDNASLEPLATTWSYTFDNAYLDTTAGAGKYLLSHSDSTLGGIDLFISPTVSGNMTGRITTLAASVNSSAYRPNAAGTYTELTASPAVANYINAGDNNDATYVGNGTASYLKDTYNIPNHSAETGAVNSITIYFRIGNNAACTTTAKPLLLTHSVLYEGTEQSNSNPWSTKSQTYTANPNTGTNWTWDEIDTLQIGAELKTNSPGNSAEMADCWIIINYSPYVYTDVTGTGITSAEHDVILRIEER